MERELTWKQEKFAAARAMGKSWVDSYREAYEPSNPKAASVYPRAHRTRDNPRVLKRIQELREYLLPLPVIQGFHQRAVAAALEVAEKGKDDKARVSALQVVMRGLEKSQKFEEEVRKPPKKPEEKKKPEEERAEMMEERAQLVEELRELYRAALPEKAQADAVVESDAEKLEENLVAEDGAPEKCQDILASTMVEESVAEVETAEPPRPQMRYELRPKPGQFGGRPQYVRVAVPVGEGE